MSGRNGQKLTLVILALVGVGVSLLVSCVNTHKKEVSVPIRSEIERAIEVQQLENKFIYVGRGVFSAAGAGGLGAPQIFAKSVEQFLELVPAEERIYVAFDYGRYQDERENHFIFKKVYWAFIENRAGLLIWEDVYTYPYTLETKRKKFIFWGEEVTAQRIELLGMVVRFDSRAVVFAYYKYK